MKMKLICVVLKQISKHEFNRQNPSLQDISTSSIGSNLSEGFLLLFFLLSVCLYPPVLCLCFFCRWEMNTGRTTTLPEVVMGNWLRSIRPRSHATLFRLNLTSTFCLDYTEPRCQSWTGLISSHDLPAHIVYPSVMMKSSTAGLQGRLHSSNQHSVYLFPLVRSFLCRQHLTFTLS